MSSTAYYCPVIPDTKFSLCSAMKFILIRYLTDTIPASTPMAEMDETSLQFLDGVVAATEETDVREDATAIIAAIKKHGRVRFWIEA
jgi:hypothetical protein